MTDRLSWNQYFIEIARLVATRSTCQRRQVGAVSRAQGFADVRGVARRQALVPHLPGALRGRQTAEGRTPRPCADSHLLTQGKGKIMCMENVGFILPVVLLAAYEPPAPSVWSDVAKKPEHVFADRKLLADGRHDLWVDLRHTAPLQMFFGVC